MVDISMAISFFSCLCLSIRIRGQLRWGIGGIKQQTSEQTIKQTKHTSKNQNKQTRVMQFDSFFFSTIGSGGSNTLFLYLFSESAILYTVAIKKKSRLGG